MHTRNTGPNTGHAWTRGDHRGYYVNVFDGDQGSIRELWTAVNETKAQQQQQQPQSAQLYQQPAARPALHTASALLQSLAPSTALSFRAGATGADQQQAPAARAAAAHTAIQSVKQEAQASKVKRQQASALDDARVAAFRK